MGLPEHTQERAIMHAEGRLAEWLVLFSADPLSQERTRFRWIIFNRRWARPPQICGWASCFPHQNIQPKLRGKTYSNRITLPFSLSWVWGYNGAIMQVKMRCLNNTKKWLTNWTSSWSWQSGHAYAELAARPRKPDVHCDSWIKTGCSRKEERRSQGKAESLT